MSLEEEPKAAKQFLAIVGDESGEIKKQLLEEVTCDEAERTITIENCYYSADVGIKCFPNVKHVADGIAHEKAFPAVFVKYESVEKLPEISENLLDGVIDVKVLIIHSTDESKDSDKIEKWAVLHGFEIVYLNPSEDQIRTAKMINERVGVLRLVETLNICDWPHRKMQTPQIKEERLESILKVIQEMENDMTIESLSIGNSTAESIFAEYLRARNLRVDTNARPLYISTPEPQHAERVHLSPDSPTGTDTTNIDNEPPGGEMSVSVDLNLVCSKTEQSNTTSGNLPDLGSVNKKKKKKNKNKGGNQKTAEDSTVLPS